MRKAPDPVSFQGQEVGESSGIWTSWLNTCSPIQHTLLTACNVQRNQSKISYSNDDSKDVYGNLAILSVKMGLGTYISEVVGSLRKGGTIS